MITRLAVLGAGLTCASAALCQTMAFVGHIKPPISAVTMQYQAKAEALKGEMAALEKSDHGRLTPEHRAYLQASANALVAAYHQDLAKVDPLSINADGTPRH